MKQASAVATVPAAVAKVNPQTPPSRACDLNASVNLVKTDIVPSLPTILWDSQQCTPVVYSSKRCMGSRYSTEQAYTSPISYLSLTL